MKVLNDGKMMPAEDLYSQKRRSEVFKKKTLKTVIGSAYSNSLNTKSTHRQ